MPVLPLLKHPSSYRACIQDLLADPEAREYWLKLFEEHVQTLARLPVGEAHLEDQPAWSVFKRDYLSGLAELRRDPGKRGLLNVLELTIYRDEKLKILDLEDPFKKLKDRENDLALRILPRLLQELDDAPSNQLCEILARGLFAGNTFDMGSRAVVGAFEAGTFDFHSAREKVRPRPWPVDDLDQWKRRSDRGRSYRQCLFFVDNAGCDIVLGVLPYVRELIRRGTKVVLAANSKPSLNDITVDELRDLLIHVSRLDRRIDDFLRDGRLTTVGSGCGSPLIDLSRLSGECCDVATASDLLIIEGMGRAIESNYDAEATVDTLKIALIKDPMVATVLGVKLFDPIWRFEKCATK